MAHRAPSQQTLVENAPLCYDVPTMAINVEVQKSATENSVTLLRRFTKRVQGSGVLPRMRSIRYSARVVSSNVKKKKTLKVLKRRQEVAKQVRLGKIVENVRNKR